jgi:hypothetical protein
MQVGFSVAPWSSVGNGDRWVRMIEPGTPTLDVADLEVIDPSEHDRAGRLGDESVDERRAQPARFLRLE